MQAAYDLLRPAWDATATSLTDKQDKHDRLAAGSTIGGLLGELGRGEEAHQFLRDLLAEYEKLGYGNSEDVIETMAAVAADDIDRADFVAAKAMAERMLAIAKANPTPNPDYLNVANDRLANALFGMEKYDEAIKVFELNLDAMVKWKGPDTPEAISNRTSLAALYKEVGRVDDADRNFREALAANRRIYEAGNPQLLTSLSVYGDFLQREKRPDEALKLLEEAKKASTLKLPPENGIVITIDGRLARVYSDLKRYDEAIALNQEVLSSLQKASPVEPAELLVVLAYMTRDQLDAGRPRDVLDTIAANTPKEGWPPNDPFYPAMLKIASGQAHLELGERVVAATDTKEARELLKQDGRTSGKQVDRLNELDAEIAAAMTRPTTQPATAP